MLGIGMKSDEMRGRILKGLEDMDITYEEARRSLIVFLDMEEEDADGLLEEVADD